MTAIVLPHVCCNDGIITDLSGYGCIPGNLGLPEKFADKKRFDANGSFTLIFSEDRKFSLQLGNNGYLSLYNLALDKSVMTWSPSGQLVSGDIGFDRVKELKSAAKKDVGNGTGQIPDMSFFPLSGIGTDNLIATFPNGLIIQVFKRTLANKAAAGEIETIPISYPIAFPRGAAAVFCTKTSYAQTLVSCENTTATGFSAVTVKVFESAGATLSTANFLAIGWQ
ncbi:gp53-like domain-containing protein [Morganella morganii]